MWGTSKTKTKTTQAHSKQIYQKPEEVTSPSGESSKNRNQPVCRQKHAGAEGGCWSQASETVLSLMLISAVWPGMSYSTSLSFSLLVCKMGLRPATTVQGWGRSKEMMCVLCS